MSVAAPAPNECRVLLFRHAESVSNEGNRFAGRTDVELTERGRAQAEKLADRIAKTEIDAAYASTLQRATKTAEIVADPHGLDVTPVSASTFSTSGSIAS